MDIDFDAMDTEGLKRGFSNTFITVPNIDMEEIKYKYIEAQELESTWKATRRQRHKEQEDKIWDNFVKEQEDLLQSVLKEDMYQFLEQIPENDLAELISELENDKRENEKAEEETQKEDEKKKIQQQETTKHQHVTFADPQACIVVSDSNINSIKGDTNASNSQEYLEFAESELETDLEAVFGMCSNEALAKETDKDKKRVKKSESKTVDESAISGDTNSSTKPTSKDHGTSPMVDSESGGGTPNKSAENIRSLVENSTYNVRIKDTRTKLKLELKNLIKTIDNENFIDIDASELRRKLKRSTEFCARFQRIYLYQLHRQIYDIRRHNSLSLPFAKNTHYQAQMLRAVSLHQNLLQAFQVFHKAMESTGCVRESGELLSTLISTAREVSEVCTQCATPPHLANNVCYTDLNTTFDSLELAKRLFDERVAPVLEKFETTPYSAKNSDRSIRSHDKPKLRRKPFNVYQTSKKKYNDVHRNRLSMYQYSQEGHGSETVLNTNKSSNTPKSSSKYRKNVIDVIVEEKKEAGNSKRKKAFRRPLMRNPHEGKPRRHRPKGNEPHTMVEGVYSEEQDIIDSPILELRQIYNEGYNSNQSSPGRGRESGGSTWRSSPRNAPPPPTPSLKPPSYGSQYPNNSARSFYTISPRKPKIIKNPGTPNVISPRTETNYQEVTRATDPMENYRKEDEEKVGGDVPKKTKKVIGGECEVSRLLRELCSGDNRQAKNERVSGAKNAQLVCVNSIQPSTPQLLKILEETIQKKVPKSIKKSGEAKMEAKYHLALDVGNEVTERTFQYRTKFVQHMLTSSMYANCTVDKPWQLVGTIADDIIDDLLQECAKEMEICHIMKELYESEVQ